MSSPHQAIVDAVRAAVPLSFGQVGVYDTVVPDSPTSSYVVVYNATGERTQTTVGRSADGLFRFQVTTVAQGNRGNLGIICDTLASAVRDGLVGARVTVDGWLCGPIEHDASTTAQRDEDVMDLPAVFRADVYRFIADRTA